MQSTSNIFERPLECKLQGNTIRYYREGSGPVVLCIHGITTYSFIWRKIAPAFTSSFDVIIPDLLGCGDSSKPLHEDISLKRQATLLADFCSHIGVSQVHLVCHDVGGGIGQIFRETTVPDSITGDGIMAAYNTGAELVDMEFL